MPCVCGSVKTEHDPTRGSTYCVQCGLVLEENSIVAEVTFGETAGGKAILQGSYVSADKGRLGTTGPYGRGRSGHEGREQAMENGRRRTQHLAHALKLPERYQESAMRYYNLALNNNFTKGRRTEVVAAVCLYVVCRQEKSSQMLIDFSDLLQINVFVLGSVFLKFVQVICIKNLPLVDPSIYISRFANCLEFGEYTSRVASDAIRLVQRMDRDWIRTGRRPAGICGACLLIAARMNGFRRTVREMIYVVKVADITITKRLNEFKATPSGQLSVRDFKALWLESEADPPAFSKGRKRNKHGQLEEEGANKAEMASLPILQDEAIVNIEAARDAQLMLPPKKRKRQNNVAAEQSEEGGDRLPASDSASITTPDDPTEESSTAADGSDKTGNAQAAKDESLSAEDEELNDEINGLMKDEAFLKAAENFKSEDFKEPFETDLADVDDDEIAAMLLNDEEVEIKTKVWYEFNKEYLEEQRIKMEKEIMDRKNGVYKKTGSRKKKTATGPAASPADAAKQLVASKKISRKINRTIFNELFEDEGSLEALKSRTSTPEPSMLATQKDSAYGGSQLRPTAAKGDEYAGYDVVEESGDIPTTNGKANDKSALNAIHEDEDDDDEDEAHMAEDEVVARKMRAFYDEDDDDF
ncbi:unnamed protein product [Umbelopsis ramanniana]